MKIENGEADIKFEQIQALSKIFEVSINDLISFSEKNLFNTTHHNHNVKNVGNIINDYQHEEMKVMYEKLLTEKDERIKELAEMNKQLRDIISKKLK